MTRFVVHGLCTEGCVIVAEETAARIEREMAPYAEASQFRTWGEFRQATLPFNFVVEVVESRIGDFETLATGIESSHQVAVGTHDLAIRWAEISMLPSVGEDDGGFPGDDAEFDWEWGCGDPGLELDMIYQGAMLDDLSKDIFKNVRHHRRHVARWVSRQDRH